MSEEKEKKVTKNTKDNETKKTTTKVKDSENKEKNEDNVIEINTEITQNDIENNALTTTTDGSIETLQISNDVIAVIAGVAVSEVSGVANMAGGFAGGISEVLSGKKNMAKGIKVEKTEDKVKIDVNIIVEYGTRIPDIAFEIQNRVKTAVENMTGMDVTEVNVHVQGVDTNVKKEDK
ncbi:MAG: Asp23/Gls24 family envelope stress response protein [Clostridia bacterium]|nr:Asp23/Gls24 family envelope stress response protein [Clostridia bacterium]